jgi:beta-lactamase class A
LTGHKNKNLYTAGILCSAIIFLAGCSSQVLTDSAEPEEDDVQIQSVPAVSESQSIQPQTGSESDDSLRTESINSVSDSAEVKSFSTVTSISVPVQMLCEKIETDFVSERTAAGEQWSVSCIDLSDGEEASLNGDAPMLSASDLKLFIMAALYEGVEEGSADRSLLSYVSDMITVSSNEAANAIVTGLGDGDAAAGEQVINEYCLDHGYSATHMGRLFLDTPDGDDNYTSSEDCAHLLQKIYLGQCVSEEASGEMLVYLKQQTRTGKIPAGLAGTGAVTANKTGELAGNGLGYAENDCAIIYGSGKDYILCVFSNDITSNSEAVTVIQQISRLTWDTLENS